jgi:DNA-binding MarR family transcriptional regulator
MHAIPFGLKRAWHGTLRATRHALACVGLTAARFDLLYVAHRRKLSPITQSQLRTTLGVNRTTISRMLASLEALGLVTRERAHGDRRTRIVRLTQQGRKQIRLAVRRLIGSGAAELLVDSAVGGGVPDDRGGRWYDDMACMQANESLEHSLTAIRRALGDVATLYYPWHPDD